MAKAAVTLTKKKTTIRKGQLKKTIKNILCRVDTAYWPDISIEDSKVLEKILEKYKVDIINFEKPNWNEIKHLPKDKRPRPPKAEKVEGLLFGISECSNSIQNGQCSAVIINGTVNPRLIIQPVLEACVKRNIPVVCMRELRKVSALKFGIPTSCLGVKPNSLTDLIKTISEISSHVKYAESNASRTASTDGSSNIDKRDMEVEDVIREVLDVSKADQTRKVDVAPKSLTPSECPYLYRSSKKNRVFTPQQGNVIENSKKFAGQDTITFSHEPTSENKKVFKSMLLKRMSNNPNRKTKKKLG